MANKTVTVKSSGGDYTSLNAALSGESADLTSASYYSGGPGILTIECYTMEDTTAADTGTGYTTSSDYYLKIIEVEGQDYKLLISSAAQTALTIQEDFVRVVGIYVKNSYDDSFAGRAIGTGSQSSSAQVFFDKCVGISPAACLRLWTFDGTFTVTNCIFIRTSSTSTTEPAVISLATTRLYNCTIAQLRNISAAYGIEASNGSWAVKNCYIYAAYSGSTINGSPTLTTTATSDTDGSAGLQSIAYSTANFLNVTSGSEDLHLASGSALIGVGTNLYNDANFPFQNDIDGQDRGGSGASWDIGADQFPLNGSICYGHITSIDETHARTFLLNWRTGTGAISGTGDSEKLSLGDGKYQISDPIYTGIKWVQLTRDKY
jgi:hypothetical protein